MALNRIKVSQKAEKLVRQGRFADAIREYQVLLEDSPHDVGTLNKVGDLYRRAGQVERALTCYLRIADHYRDRGFSQKAIAMYKKVAKLDPSHAEVREQLASLFTEQGLVRDALENLREAARLFSDAGESERALELESRALELQPDDWHGLRLQAERLRDAGETERSVATFLRAAEGFAGRNDLENALSCCREAGQVAPLDPAPVGLLTRTLLEADRAGDAVEEIRALMDGENERPDLNALLGEALLRLGDLDAAEAALQAARGSAFAEGDVHFQTSLLRLNLARQRFEEAEEGMERVVGVLVEQGECRAARAVLQECLEVMPSSRRALTRLVERCREAEPGEGDKVESLELLARTLPEDEMRPALIEVLQALRSSRPEDRELAERLEALGDDSRERPAGGSGQPDELSKPLEGDQTFTLEGTDGSEVDREFVAEHLTEADVFIKYGLLPKAAAHLSLIVERHPRTIVAHQRLVEVYLGCGDRESAVRHLVLLTEAYRLRGTGDDALRSINAALEHEPDNPSLAAIKQALREGRPLPSYPSRQETRGQTGPAAAAVKPPPPATDEEVIDLEPEGDAGQRSEPVVETSVADAPPVQLLPQPAAGGGVIDFEPEDGAGQPVVPVPVAETESPPVASVVAAPAAGKPVPSVPGDRSAPPDQPPVGTSPPAADTEGAGAGGDFFDLAGAIERELAEEESEESGIPVVDDSEEAVDPLTGIHRAIQDQVGAEDHQTHYQLGIAFKEMGMLDEAIGEFQQASRNPESFVSCCSMLGLCFREKKMPQIAERWYARGLTQASAGAADAEERLGLLYDMGELFLAAGQSGKAQECFLEVYASSAHYRDVAAHLREIGEIQEGDPPPRAGR